MISQLMMINENTPDRHGERYLKGSHGNHYASLNILRAAQIVVLGQEVMRHGHKGVAGPALEPVHGAA